MAGWALAHSCAHTPSGWLRAVQGCRCWCRDAAEGSLTAPFLIGGNAKGFALSFPKQNSRPRVAVAARPLARARAAIQLSLPLPSSPEGRAACRSQCGILPRKEGFR